nr:unnamed protein product [Callosobruchus chinensis]
MFLNTLNISEKTVRTALAKKQVTGIVEKEKRGGRYQILKNKDDEITNAIKAHIQRFSRMESHYCRKSSSREYLHPDLNLTKMFDMFVEEYSSCNITTTYQTYGKNEGDSAHSAITSAMNKAAEIMVPSQLIPVCRLARKKNPYSVHALATEDFLDFKSLATDLRLLSVRQDDDGNTLDWRKMYEFKVEKSTPNKLYFKDTHLTETYRAITLKKRCKVSLNDMCVQKLNKEPPKIAGDKYRLLTEKKTEI